MNWKNLIIFSIIVITLLSIPIGYLTIELEKESRFVHISIYDPDRPNLSKVLDVTVIIGQNNTVVWHNRHDAPIALASDYSNYSWASPGVIKPGESFKHTFEKPGVFNYHGEPPPWLTGTITVHEIKKIN